MANADTACPRLRPVDIRQTLQGGRPAFVLRDPLQISDQALVVPQPLGAILALCDGTHEVAAIRAAVGMPSSVAPGPDLIDELLTALDNALLLDNQRFALAHAVALASYRAAPFRPMSHAGAVYPAAPGELKAMVRQYSQRAGPVAPTSNGRGVFSPHIDYQRGGVVYAAVWQRAAALARAADLVVLLATDHYGEEGTITLTRQHYATPFGVLPTATAAVDTLATALGPAAFAGELRHRSEHAIELVALWLHAIRDGQPVELVPILVGSFGHFVRGEANPANDPAIDALLAALQQVTAGRTVLYVVSGDLAHVGPAFGTARVDSAGRARIKAADDELLAALCATDAARFFSSLQQIGDCNNVCGLPPGYLALRALGAGQGELVAYEQCPADGQFHSLVSVAGAVL